MKAIIAVVLFMTASTAVLADYHPWGGKYASRPQGFYNSSSIYVSKGSVPYVNWNGAYSTAHYSYASSYTSSAWVRSDIMNSSSGMISFPGSYGGGMYVPYYMTYRPVVVDNNSSTNEPAQTKTYVAPAPERIVPDSQPTTTVVNQPGYYRPIRRGGLFGGPPTVIQINLNIGFGGR